MAQSQQLVLVIGGTGAQGVPIIQGMTVNFLRKLC